MTGVQTCALPISYKKWIEGADKPTVKQLKLISWKTKRPLALFFSDKIPKEKPLPKDYRLNPEKEGKFNFSKFRCYIQFKKYFSKINNEDMLSKKGINLHHKGISYGYFFVF